MILTKPTNVSYVGCNCISEHQIQDTSWVLNHVVANVKTSWKGLAKTAIYRNGLRVKRFLDATPFACAPHERDLGYLQYCLQDVERSSNQSRIYNKSCQRHLAVLEIMILAKHHANTQAKWILT